MDKYYLVTIAYKKRGSDAPWHYEYDATRDVFEFIKSLIEQYKDEEYKDEEYKVVYHLEIDAQQYQWIKDNT